MSPLARWPIVRHGYPPGMGRFALVGRREQLPMGLAVCAVLENAAPPAMWITVGAVTRTMSSRTTSRS